MKKRAFFGLAIAVALISLATGINFPQAAHAGQLETNSSLPGSATAAWTVGWADKSSSDAVGTYPSIAFNPAGGLPYISYYDAINGDLMLAHPSSAGNCGTDNRWSCQPVDASPEEDVGKYSSIAFWGDSDHWTMGISYYDQTNGALRFAFWDQVGDEPGSWEIQTISDPGTFGTGAGLFSSLQFGSDGVPQIAYYYSYMLGNDAVKYAYYVKSGGNCGVAPNVGAWQCDTVESGDKVGKFTSLDLDASDSPRIAYYDELNGNLKFAYLDGSTWRTAVVDAFSDDSGKFASLQVSATAPVWRIAYYNATAGKLKYAYYVGSGGNCGLSSISLQWEWQCDEIDSMGIDLEQVGIALATDQGGNAIIAYEDAAEDLEPTKLNIARPAGAIGLLTGNCGPIPQGGLFQTWQCTTLDNALYGIGYVNVAAHTAIAVNSTGLAMIAYSETDDYYMRTNLKVAYQELRNFLPLVIK